MAEILPIRAFSDNYIWLIRGAGKNVTVVDPGDAAPVIDYLDAEGLALTRILITHKHRDHVGGVAALLRRWPGCEVCGPANEGIASLTRTVGEGERIAVDGIDDGLAVLETPGHTEGHLTYYGGGVLFCGDTLFLCGCGRIFSGTHPQMAASLRRLAALPGETRVFCAHEYTLANIGFAKWVEPENPLLLEREAAAKRRLAAGEPTVPATLAEELATNPFLRTAENTVVAAAEKWYGKPLGDSAAVFTALREWKDQDYD